MSDTRTRRVLRDGIVVQGPDTFSWLQGQLSQDVEDLPTGETRWALVLSPQGKVDSLCRVTRTAADRAILDLEAGYGEGLFERLRRFKIRVKATLEPVRVCCVESLGRGFDAFGPPEVVTGADSREPDGEDEDEDEAFEAARIRAGLPRLGRDLTDRTIPQEAGEALVERTVSFTKGCYTGQELVARLDSRGSNVPRRLRLVTGGGASGSEAAPAGSPELPAPGDELRVAGEEAGRLTSVAAVDGGYVAMAYVKRSALTGDDLTATVVTGEAREVPAVVTGFEVGT